MRRLLLDTNLLVLLVVGQADRALVRTHPRTQSYSVEDYDLLVQMLGRFQQVVVTAGVLAECSNLLRLKGRKDGPRLMAAMAGLFGGGAPFDEEGLPARAVSATPVFVRHGYTDAVLSELASETLPLLTTDHALYQVVAARCASAAINFIYDRWD